MIRTRRSALLLVLTVAVLLGAALPANALFADAATVTTGAVSTLTVAGPGNVRVETTCTTTTTVIRRVFDSTTNAQLSYSETRSTATSTSNVESNTTVRTNSSPVVGQHTTVQTIKDTMLFASAKWNRSNSRGVTGYRMTVFFANGQTFSMADVPASANQMDDSYDANVVDLGARLSMVTVTSYGWTAPGNLSNVVTC